MNLLSQAANFAAQASGAANLYQGGHEFAQNMARGGTWGGVARGLGRVALGAGQLGVSALAAATTSIPVTAIVASRVAVGTANWLASPSENELRASVTSDRNSVRHLIAGRPAQQPQTIGQLANVGLHPTMTADLAAKEMPFSPWATSTPAHDYPKSGIRVTAQNPNTNNPGAVPSFGGSGLDENVACRIQSSHHTWSSPPTSGQERDIFNARSRTADLIWATHPSKAEPIAGHTPSVKNSPVGGVTGSITVEHSERDTRRGNAVHTTFNDMSSPDRLGDTGVVSSLATIREMASPSTELRAAQPRLAGMPARYTNLTGHADIRQPAHFDNMVAHVQEARERQKWETASVMKSDSRLSPLVPPTMASYLHASGNNPLQAMDSFRHDTHQSRLPAPPINHSLRSNTVSMEHHSLNDLVVSTQTSGQRARALSDARELPATKPANRRGSF